jgi:hypothetical protein
MCINKQTRKILLAYRLVIFKVKAVILAISQLSCGKDWPGLFASSGGPAIMEASWLAFGATVCILVYEMDLTGTNSEVPVFDNWNAKFSFMIIFQ